jgi:IS4 transposase
VSRTRQLKTLYTFTDGTQAMIAMKASLDPDQTKLSFIVILLDWSINKIHDEYRRRFGVECSSRLLHPIRATTTSHNPVLRFFLLSVGLILVNAWFFLYSKFARRMVRGSCRMDEPRF